jgi:hypothetical protein
MSHYNGAGQCTGRCDANCYNAQERDCDCICGGANHGKGYKTAMENTGEIAKRLLKGNIKFNPVQTVLF